PCLPDPSPAAALRLSLHDALPILCDEMLKGVGRWLRAAGYDAAIVDNGAGDDALLARARAERRLLLTCDRGFAARVGDDPAITVDRKSTRLHSSHVNISYAVFCLK